MNVSGFRLTVSKSKLVGLTVNVFGCTGGIICGLISPGIQSIVTVWKFKLVGLTINVLSYSSTIFINISEDIIKLLSKSYTCNSNKSGSSEYSNIEGLELIDLGNNDKSSFVNVDIFFISIVYYLLWFSFDKFNSIYSRINC